MSVGRHIARLLIDCEAKDGETKKAHLSVNLFDTAYGAGTRRTVSYCEGMGFAGLELGGFSSVPHRVAIYYLVLCGARWNRTGVRQDAKSWKDNFALHSIHALAPLDCLS